MPSSPRTLSGPVGRFLGAAALAASLSGSLFTAEQRPPLNILLFTADDMDHGSVGCFGGTPTDLTPNLNRFAAQGMRFERAHVVAAICMPSRIALVTGLYCHRSGAMGFRTAKTGTPHAIGLLQQAGYLTGILGKVSHSTPTSNTSWDFSFDREDLGDGRDPAIYQQRCRDFFATCKAEQKPFYFMVNSHDPHRPFHTAGQTKKGSAEPSKTYLPEDVTVPGFLPDLPGVRKEMSAYYNSVRRCDDTFGRTMAALEEAGYADNTLVIFLSDNGIAMPFGKANCYLASTLTPLIVRWPGQVQPGTVDREHFVSGVDYLPTILEATGQPLPADLDGRSIVPLLKGTAQEGRKQVFTQIDYLIDNSPVPMRCIQDARYGYIFNPWSDGEYTYSNANEGETMREMNKAAKKDPAIAERVQMFRHRVLEEFYDLQDDPSCLKNLIDDPRFATQRAAMTATLREWMVKTRDPALAAFDLRADAQACTAAMLAAFTRGGQQRDQNAERGGAIEE